jgi:hypothetical protein
MPASSKENRRVELHIDRDRVTVEEFVAALQELFDLVRDVSSSMYGDRLGKTKWVITSLQAGSAFAAAEAEVAAPDVPRIQRVLSTTARGLATIERRASRPRHFSDKALSLAASLSSRLGAAKAGRATVRLGTTSFQPTTRVKANVQTLTAGSRKSIGAIEGRLVGIAERERVELYIEEPVRHARIRCNIPEEMVSAALAAFRDRVQVRGVIWENAEGLPREIDVKGLERMPSPSDLPTAEDVRGILRRG